MTLTELVVAMFIALLMLTAAYQLLIGGLRSWTTANMRSHVRQTALSVLTRIIHDVKMSSVEALVVIPGTYDDAETGDHEEASSLTLLCPYDDQGRIRYRDGGEVVWQKYLVFYLDGPRHEIRLGERPLVYDATGSVLYRLKTFVPDPRDRVIGRNVRGLGIETAVDPYARDFGASPAAAQTRTNPVTVRLHVRDRNEDCRLETAASTLLVGEAASTPP